MSGENSGHVYCQDRTGSEMFSYGQMVLTCDDFPRIISMSEEMFKMLGISDINSRFAIYLRDNILFMIPQYSRRKFENYLIMASERPMNIEHDALTADGETLHLVGWIRRSLDYRSEQYRYYIAYVDVSEAKRMQSKDDGSLEQDILRYSFDEVFKFDLGLNIVYCLKGTVLRSSDWRQALGKPASSAAEYFISHVIDDSSREEVRSVFCEMFKRHQPARGLNRGEIEFTIEKTGDRFFGKFFKLCEDRVYFVANAVNGNIQHRANQMSDCDNRIWIRTFGYFDVFIDGKAIPFKSEKAKELLAVMVDRRGGFVSSDEVISYMWPDEPNNKQVKSRIRKVALRLRNILKDYGIEDIIEEVNGQRRIVTENVSCDLYEYMEKGNKPGRQSVESYMQNYSWSEMTRADLMGSKDTVGEEVEAQ